MVLCYFCLFNDGDGWFEINCESCRSLENEMVLFFLVIIFKNLKRLYNEIDLLIKLCYLLLIVRIFLKSC